jgi:enamine deaminase RidA (YjgF/YER057c/UK114 family)
MHIAWNFPLNCLYDLDLALKRVVRAVHGDAQFAYCPTTPTSTVQAVRAGNTLYVSGQIGIVPGTNDFASDGVEGQTEQV